MRSVQTGPRAPHVYGLVSGGDVRARRSSSVSHEPASNTTFARSRYFLYWRANRSVRLLVAAEALLHLENDLFRPKNLEARQADVGREQEVIGGGGMHLAAISAQHGECILPEKVGDVRPIERADREEAQREQDVTAVLCVGPADRIEDLTPAERHAIKSGPPDV